MTIFMRTSSSRRSLRDQGRREPTCATGSAGGCRGLQSRWLPFSFSGRSSPRERGGGSSPGAPCARIGRTASAQWVHRDDQDIEIPAAHCKGKGKSVFEKTPLVRRRHEDNLPGPSSFPPRPPPSPLPRLQHARSLSPSLPSPLQDPT